MTIGGRPEEDGGYKWINLSVDAETFNALKKISKRGDNRSRFVENVVRPHINQLDPGESCKVLHQIDETLDSEMVSALLNRNYEKLTTLATIRNTLDLFRNLCKISNENDNVGMWKLQNQRIHLREIV